MSKQIRGISLRMEILWRYQSNGTGYEIQQLRQDENFCRIQAGEHGCVYVWIHEAEEKEEGEREMIPRKRMNPALARMSQQSKDNILISAAGKASLIISLMVLADKFDFTGEKLDKFIVDYHDQLDAYNSGRVESVKDFTEVLKEEYGIEVM